MQTSCRRLGCVSHTDGAALQEQGEDADDEDENALDEATAPSRIEEMRQQEELERELAEAEEADLPEEPERSTKKVDATMGLGDDGGLGFAIRDPEEMKRRKEERARRWERELEAANAEKQGDVVRPLDPTKM